LAPGQAATSRQSQLGLKTVIIEREHLGGICLNWGCIPTKALLRTSELYHLMGRASEFGLAADNIRFDLARVVERSRKVAARLANGVAYLMQKNKIAVVDGTATLQVQGTIAVRGKDGQQLPEIEAKHIVIATGARAKVLPGLEPDGKLFWTYKEAMVPASFPKSMLIVGSGAIGIEFASFYRTLGAEVTVVEMLDRILPSEDAEISALARKAFAKQDMVIHTRTAVEHLARHGDSVTATLRRPDGIADELTVDRVILAIGITGNVEGLGLEEQGVKIEKGHIVVDQWCPDSHARRLRDRRRGRTALACPQGEP
jgi:dihydrolipoyl dehydrogenase